MKLGKFKHLFAFLLTAMASITLAFLVRFSIEGIMQPKKLASYSSDKLIEEDFDMEQSASSIANNLLTDSILTIIQNYYVDDSRVKSMELLENGLYFLTEDRKYKLKVDGDRYFLSANSQTLKLDIKEPFDYNQLLDHSFRISRFLSKVEGLEKTYKEDYWQDKGTFKFLNTVLHSLDPHSSLLNSSEYDELKQGTEGTFGGLGVVVSFENSMLRVVKTIDNSPASSVGIKPGNLIVSINGKNTFGLSLDEIISLMRGKSGTKVDLDILAENAFSTKTVSIHRKVVRVNSVEEEVISYKSKNFLKLYVESFSSSTADEVDQLIKSYPEIDGVILDLRSNPGGLLDQAVKVSDLFLEKGDIVSTQGRYEEVERARYSDRDYSYPVMVLINADTASASEIVAGSLKDNNRAIIIGQPSFGKGSVQTVFELPGGQALKLTVARYYTPSGTSIQNVGVYPDIWMQGVYEADKNLNILGDNRYLEERFLANSLQTNEEDSARKSNYKFYYMHNGEDQVLDFSKKLLAKVSTKFGSNIEDSYMRSSLWLARNHEYIVKQSTRQENQVAKYLEQNHRLNWGVEAKYKKSELKLSVEPIKENSYIEGGKLKVNWSVKNNSGFDIDRVSVILKEGKEWGRSFEKLVGRVSAGSSVTGFIEVPLPDVINSQEISYNLSFAQSSVYSLKDIHKFKVLVNPIKDPEINYKVSLVDTNGNRINQLKPGSRGFIEIDIQNNSSTDLNGFNYKVFNLTGKQIVLGENTKRSNLDRNLKSHDHLTLRLPLKSSYKLTSKRLKFGLQLQALNSIYQHNKVFELSTSRLEVGDE